MVLCHSSPEVSRKENLWILSYQPIQQQNEVILRKLLILFDPWDRQAILLQASDSRPLKKNCLCEDGKK